MLNDGTLYQNRSPRAGADPVIAVPSKTAHDITAKVQLPLSCLSSLFVFHEELPQ
jgi:hypothetical protein